MENKTREDTIPERMHVEIFLIGFGLGITVSFLVLLFAGFQVFFWFSMGGSLVLSLSVITFLLDYNEVRKIIRQEIARSLGFGSG